MNITRLPKRDSQIGENSISLWRLVFPAHRSIAAKTMAAAALIYSVFILARITWSRPDDYGLAIGGFLGLLVVTIIFIWFLYRLLVVIGETEASKVIIILTLPALMLAIGASYLNSLIMDSTNQSTAGMATFDLLFIHYLILAGWGGLYLALVQGEATRKAVVKSELMVRLTRESELRALRFQLNPHFVFNALNSVSSLVIDQQNQKAELLVERLADYMRVVLKDEGENIITVKEEIEQQIRYLEIEKVRFPERLKFETHIDEDVADWRIPALIVQPLIENAIKYGVARATGPVRIMISAAKDANRLKLTVANDGRMTSNDIASDGTGTGLANVVDRLEAVYGPSASLTTANSGDGMAVASIVVPDESFIFPGN